VGGLDGGRSGRDRRRADLAEARARLLDTVRRMTPAAARPGRARVLVEELEVVEA
jgi:hypothetical protein